MKKILLTIALLLPIAVFSQTVISPQEKASKELVEAMDLKRTFGETITAMVKVQSALLPEDKREKFSEVMKTFMGKYYTYDIFMPQIANVYAQEFSETELKELTKFYKSETGKKFSSKLASLSTKGAIIGQNIVASHKEELAKMMEEAFAIEK